MKWLPDMGGRDNITMTYGPASEQETITIPCCGKALKLLSTPWARASSQINCRGKTLPRCLHIRLPYLPAINCLNGYLKRKVGVPLTWPRHNVRKLSQQNCWGKHYWVFPDSFSGSLIPILFSLNIGLLYSAPSDLIGVPSNHHPLHYTPLPHA